VDTEYRRVRRVTNIHYAQRATAVTDQDILNVFTRTLRDLIGDDSIMLAMNTRRSDVAGWDSFMYVNFIVAIELELKIKFSVADLESFETVGDIVAEAQSLLG
jgi:acyl carrier protein